VTGQPTRTPLRVVIADDEPLGRERIASLLAAEPDVEIVGEASSGDGAVRMIRELRPDLVFLDYEMPEKNGFAVVREIGPDAMPPTIFVTAHEEHALGAFDVAALDYLVKPFDDDRFEQALNRARRAVAPSPPEYLERIPVESRGKVLVVPVADIDYILAAGVYAELHVGDRRYLVRESMQTLAERLDPRVFMRIHRSVIVRVDLVKLFLRGEGGDYEVVLENGVRLRVSRSRREELERRLGMAG
jgi:two-component system LytT family response regulator